MIQTLFSLAGAFVYRMRGGMPPKLPRPLDQAIFALPYAVVAYFSCSSVWMFAPWAALVVASLTLILTTIVLLKGHGNSMDLGERDTDPEWYEVLTRFWLFKLVPLYWYDAIALSISGFLITLPVGVATLNPLLAVSGLLKGPAYMLSKRAGSGTEGGELLTGALLWGALVTI